MYPIDTLKTHVQCDRCGKFARPGVSFGTDGCVHALKSLVRAEGFGRLWRGVSTMFVGCIPAHAAYFSIFEECKRLSGADQPGHHPLAAAGCGVVATLAHDSIMGPMDTIKQRLQLGHYRGLLHCAARMVASEGLGGFFVSLPTTLAMNLPFGAVMVTTNEGLREGLKARGWLCDATGQHTIASYLVAGSVAGAVAAVATTPLDMVKTRLQTQSLTAAASDRSTGGSASGGGAGAGGKPHAPALRATQGIGASSGPGGPGGLLGAPGPARRVVTVSHHPAAAAATAAAKAAEAAAAAMSQAAEAPRVTSFSGAARAIYAEGGGGLTGVLSFYRGVVPRLLVAAPSVAVSWTAYECAKDALRDFGV